MSKYVRSNTEKYCASGSGNDCQGKNSIFSSWPHFSDDEINAAANVLRSGKVNYWTGVEGINFEHEFEKFVGNRFAIAVANGTAALELALYALGFGPGDEVITPSRTFIASASAVVLRGATPIIADVDPDSQNLTAETVKRVISPRTRGIIAVHLAGWPCDMDPLMDLAREHGLKVIEDCAQAHGATYKGRMVGSLGDIAAFSFCQDKIMSTGGEGGMLTTNDSALWERAWAYRDHGKSYQSVFHKEHPPGFRWYHDTFGTNWRLTEMQSAIGRVLLGKLPGWVEQRRRNAAVLAEELGRIPALRIPIPPADVGHAYYKFYCFVRPERLRQGWSRDRILEAIVTKGIPCFTGSCSEIYLEKAFRDAGLTPQERYRVAKDLGETSLMFLVHPTLNQTDMEDTSLVVAEVFGDACR